SVVRLRYELHDCDGHALEDEGAELEYLHGGFGGVFPKVEQALEGKDVGEEVSVTLDPDDAFGEYDAELLRVEPRNRFPEAIEIDAEGLRVRGIDADADPADEGAPVGFQPRHVGDGPSRRIDERPVDAEGMRVAVHDEDRFREAARGFREGSKESRVGARLSF